MKNISKWSAVFVLAAGIFLFLPLIRPALAEEKILMPDLTNLKLDQERFLVDYCDKKSKSRPLYAEVYLEIVQDKVTKTFSAYFKNSVIKKPSIVTEEENDSMIIYADFNTDGVVDMSGEPGDPKMGKGPCDLLYNFSGITSEGI